MKGATTTPAGARELIAQGLRRMHQGQTVIGKGYIVAGVRELRCWFPEVFSEVA